MSNKHRIGWLKVDIENNKNGECSLQEQDLTSYQECGECALIVLADIAGGSKVACVVGQLRRQALG